MIHRPMSRKINIVVRELEEEVLLYDLNRHTAYCLNQTTALVYRLSDGTHSIAEISERMSQELKTVVNEDLVWLALQQLKKQNLLESHEALTPQLSGLSRRSLLKKARTVSVAMLPTIISVVAPQAAMAATCIPFMSPCVPGRNGCCPGSLCDGAVGRCGCKCLTPGDCLTQTTCPSQVNCNGSGVCAP